MAQQFTASEAAEQIGTAAKILRRFLRAHPQWNNPGSAGRYSFTPSDIRVMKNQFTEWSAGKSTPVPKPSRGGARTRTRPADPAYTDEDAWTGGPIPTRLEGAARAAAEQRVERLEKRLKARGLHISQMRDRDGWEAVAQAS